MASMHDIKSRIKGIKETRQITKAMKLIAAAKLKKARYQLDQTLPYFDKVKLTIADILTHTEGIDHPFFDLRHEKQGKKKAYIVLTADKGLSGSYNHNILKLAEEKLKDNPDSLLFVAGYMGRGYFVRRGYNVDMNFIYAVQNPTVYRAREISEIILDSYKKGEIDEVYILYTMMESSLKQEPHLMKLLPLDPIALMEELKSDKRPQKRVSQGLIYEPSPEAVLNVLIRKYIKGIIYGAFVESFTSEQSARMSAMDNATSNADEMLAKLNLFYNRARQAAITQEISETVSGASALKK